ncbi:MAG TPA: sigma-54 dependent transcriptional regulator, partial [Kofleriaceae bacterium]|nr:sigma-54 dependent transcriptional regulator [Kofleriaceae bacterium]
SLAFGRREQAAYTEAEVEFMGEVAKLVAVAVENATAFREIAQLKDKLAAERLYLESEIRTEHAFEEIVGDSQALRGALQQVEVVAATDSTVLLLGESGTGKEVAARAIHAHGARATKPFMAINCAALSETLLESELFGHEKGAFTGATERKRGRLELADGGTFFLDEVGELKHELQAKLLRVLQERRFERVGGSRTLEVDVRWIAATNRDLRAMIDGGHFREDLYHRLAVFPIKLPPLRERRADLLPIARALLVRIAADLKRGVPKLTPAAEQRLLAASWRGNVRELANALERAAILADNDSIDAAHLWLDEPAPAATAHATAPAGGAVRPLVELEKDAILHALEVVGGNRRKAAELLGIGERTLYDKLKKYGVE